MHGAVAGRRWLQQRGDGAVHVEECERREPTLLETCDLMKAVMKGERPAGGITSRGGSRKFELKASC